MFIDHFILELYLLSHSGEEEEIFRKECDNQTEHNCKT